MSDINMLLTWENPACRHGNLSMNEREVPIFLASIKTDGNSKTQNIYSHKQMNNECIL